MFGGENKQRDATQEADFQRYVQNSDVDADEVKKILPLAKIRKIIKHDPDIRMLNEETPYLMIKLCELFIADMTLRTWNERIDPSNRATLQTEDFDKVVKSHEQFDFQVDESCPGGTMGGNVPQK